MATRNDTTGADPRPAKDASESRLKGWLRRIADWASSGAKICRATFDRLSAKTAPAIVVLIAGTVTGVVTSVINGVTAKRCPEFPIDPLRLQATFDAQRFVSLLSAEGERCAAAVPWVFFSDIVFSLAYPFALSALFLWLERWRRFPADATDASTYPAPQTRQNLLVVAPFIAALLDIFPEDILLGAAATIKYGWWSTPFVWIGSAGAALKWVTLALFGWGVCAELLEGPRGRVIKMLRFSVLGAVLGTVPLLVIPQGQDILQRVVEGEHFKTIVATNVLALAFVGWAVWYCGRKLIQLYFADLSASGRGPNIESGWFVFYAEYIPRLLGTGAIVVSAAALANAGLASKAFAAAVAIGLTVIWLARRGEATSDAVSNLRRRALFAGIAGLSAIVVMGGYTAYEFGAAPPEIRRLRFASGLCLAAAWAFFFWVQYRRLIRNSSASESQRTADALQAPENHLRQVARASRIAIVVSIALMLAFAWFAVPVGRFFGPLWVLALTVANAIFVGTLLIRFSSRYRFPLVRFMLVLAVLFGIWNDNHIVRTLPRSTTSPANGTDRRPFGTYYSMWRDADSTAGSAPIVLVAAAGGGLRAAYWAAASLAAIADADSTFPRRVLAISGVSGGSLGAAMFVALVRDANGKPSSLPCAALRATSSRVDTLMGAYTRCVHRLMEDDYLSPVLAKLAAPDLTQRFLPMSIAAFDRSTGLEMAWEQSYRDATNDSTFDQAFLQLRDTSARPTTPLLLLNATHVETGRRYIASSSQLAGIVHDAADIHHALGDTVDLPLSTAVHNSARFTYVSPPGRLATSDTLGHVVDGGYFENSGLVTVQELFAAISRDTLGIARRRPLVVIYLCNDAKSCAHDINPVIRDSSAKAPPGLGNEALGPVNAVLNARDARGSLARAQLLQAVDSAHFIQLNVCDSVPRLLTTAPDTAVKPDAQVLEQSRKRAVSPPLGWLLSKLARDWMDASISAEPMRGDGVCRTHNVAARRRLSSFLGGGR